MQDDCVCAVAQFAPTLDVSANLATIEQQVKLAAKRGTRLFIAPEYSSGFEPKIGAWVTQVAQTLNGPFVDAISALAASYKLTIIIGMLEQHENGVSNTVIAVSDSGKLLDVYRKVHLYDAFGARESDWLIPGDKRQPAKVVEACGLRIGLQSCYDLRFPEMSRRLAVAGANVLAVPAQWVPGPLKEHHWRTLLTARAIENTAYVVAADHPAPNAIGASCIIDARGITLASMGTHPGIALAWLDSHELEQARQENPVLKLRKYCVGESDV